MAIKTELINIEFSVDGQPGPGGSKKGKYNPVTKKVNMRPDSKREKPWRALVTIAAAEAMGNKPVMEGPLRLTVVFRRLRPKGHYRTGRYAGMLKDSAPKYPTTKPDATKLLRSTEDAMRLWARPNLLKSPLNALELPEVFRTAFLCTAQFPLRPPDPAFALKL